MLSEKPLSTYAKYLTLAISNYLIIKVKVDDLTYKDDICKKSFIQDNGENTFVHKYKRVE